MIHLPSSPSRGQPLRPFLAPTLDLQEMESSQLRLLELLQFAGVSPETSAVLNALMRRCISSNNLSEYVLQCVNETLGRQGLNLEDVQTFVLDSYACSRPLPGMLLRVQLIDLVADALNDEAARWVTDFLLIGNDL